MFYVYILTNYRNTVFYTGSTDNIQKRTQQHKDGYGCFTSKYKITKLVYVELHDTRDSALKREIRIKKWKREWKILLVEGINPRWRDLSTCLL